MAGFTRSAFVTLACLGAGVAASAQASDGGAAPWEMPVVPAHVLENARAEVKQADADFALAQGPEITIRPGAAIGIAVALDHINRISLPFDRPFIATASGEQTQIVGSTIYIAPKTDAPISMFVAPDGADQLAFSLTLVPQPRPPANYVIRFPSDVVIPRPRTDTPTQGRESDYVEMIRSTFVDLALARVPAGYDLLPRPGTLPLCAAPEGVSATFDFTQAQVFAGAMDEYVVVATASAAADLIALEESWCAATGVKAVAYWPHAVLQPHEKVEVFIVAAHPSEPAAAQRPSLIGR